MIAKAGGGSKVINTSIDNDVQPRKIPVAGMGSTNVTGNFGHRTTTYSASEIDAALTLMMLRNDTGKKLKSPAFLKPFRHSCPYLPGPH